MKFIEIPLQGAFLIEMEKSNDERGFFCRIFSAKEFNAHHIEKNMTEISISRSFKAGTLRGMHFQKEPHVETKLVRVVKGAVFDVIVDIRSHSQTFLQWYGIELSAEKGGALFIPGGFAHGYITLHDNTDVLYQITDTFCPESVAGIAWDDPTIGIQWPKPPLVISQRDSEWPSIQGNSLPDAAYNSAK